MSIPVSAIAFLMYATMAAAVASNVDSKAWIGIALHEQGVRRREFFVDLLAETVGLRRDGCRIGSTARRLQDLGVDAGA